VYDPAGLIWTSNERATMSEKRPFPTPLTDLAILRVSGADAAAFLQAQLSSDVRALVAGAAQMSSWNTPAGKTLATPRLLRSGPEEIFLVLPGELSADVAEGLGRFVLRSRVTIDQPAGLRVFGTTGTGLPERTVVHGALDDGTGRALLVAPADTPVSGDPGPGVRAWREADVRSARPQVYPATSGRFVAQMLNLDLVGGISFEKGCYPGQEVIARARYLGRVKRRMALFGGSGATPPAPGGALAGLPNTAVVDACESADGWLALAVAPLAGVPLSEGVKALALPYAIPDALAEQPDD
jgi:folate-binding protein YgfZ